MRRILPLLGIAGLAVAGCSDQTPTAPAVTHRLPSLSLQVSPESFTLLGDASGGPEAFLASVNHAFAGQGYAVRGADLLLASTADPSFKTTVLANDREHRLEFQFVAGDPRRGTVGDIVRQASFLPLMSAPTSPTTSVNAKPSVDASFATWNRVSCSTLTVVNNVLPTNVLPSAILVSSAFIENPLLSDVNTVGFLPGAIFDAVFGPGASRSILAVTFPFVWVDAAGNPTDINGDGEDDSAFAEIWYNAAFRWTSTGLGNAIDIETVALHENGHALSLGHFGMIWRNHGVLRASPRAVMNAFYGGPLRSPLGTDNASFCGYWASWPN